MFGKLGRLVFILAVLDFLATQACLVLADYARRSLPFGRDLHDAGSFDNPYLHLILAVIFPSVFLALSVYDVRRDSLRGPVGDLRSLTMAVAAGTFVFAGVLYFSLREVPRLMVIYFFLFELASLSLIRLMAGLGLRIMHERGRPLSRILLVGSGEAAEAVALAVSSRLGSAVKFVGCAEDGAASGPQGLPVLGGLADVPRLVAEHDVDEVILALPSERYAAAESLAFSLLATPVRVRLVPDFLRLVVVQSSVETLGGMPLIGLREPRISGVQWAVKRLFDLALTTLGLLLALPAMLAIAIAIRLDTPGPVIFKQLRVGENGQPFWMYKFRTMASDAERHEPLVVLDERGRPRDYKHRGDTRVTRVGCWLRKTSLDELPQLFNVLKGDMSLVGPRPELRLIVNGYEDWQRQRLAVPPGITGWWQVSGRSDLPMHLNTQYDLYYIRNYSLWLDLKILWMTVWAVFRGQGAY